MKLWYKAKATIGKKFKDIEQIDTVSSIVICRNDECADNKSGRLNFMLRSTVPLQNKKKGRYIKSLYRWSCFRYPIMQLRNKLIN